eukprot:12912248-Prorocentrum_lima.AAC.1
MAALHAPIAERKKFLVAVPQIWVRLGTVRQQGAAWRIRRAVYGMRESPRFWQEEREKNSHFGEDCNLY